MPEQEPTGERVFHEDIVFAPSALEAFGDRNRSDVVTKESRGKLFGRLLSRILGPISSRKEETHAFAKTHAAQGLRSIDTLLAPALRAREVHPGVESFILDQARAAHFKRCMSNEASLLALSEDSRNSDLLKQYLALDVPTTAQALEVLNGTDDLSSIEIAKLTHPYDWDVSDTMDCYVQKNLLDVYGSDRLHFPDRSEAYSTLKLLNVYMKDGVSIAMLERKRDFAYVDGEQPIVIAKPFVFLIDLNLLTELSVQDGGVDVNLRNTGASLRNTIMGASQFNTVEPKESEPKELKSKLLRIERFLKPSFNLDHAQRPDWLQPLTTSYYAFRIPLEEPKA